MQNQRIGALFARYAIPALIAMLVSGTYQIIDGIFVGRYIGSDGLAAINLAWPLIGVMLAVGLMVGIGIGSHVSLSRGAGDREIASSYIGQLPLLMIIPGILLSIILFLFGHKILAFQGATGKVLEYGNDFLIVVTCATPLVLGSIAAPYLMRNLNAPRLATTFMVVGALINILLDYVFIVLLEMELVGAALATVIAETTAMILALIYIFSRRSPVRVQRRHFKPRMDLSWKISKNGSSSLFMYLYLGATVVAYNFMFMRYGGAIEVAAYAVTGYLLTFYYLLSEGLAHGMQPIVSRFYGEKQIDSAKHVLKLAMMFSVGGGVLFTLALLLFPSLFAGFFAGDNQSLQQVIIHAIRISLFVLFIQGFFVVTEAFFQAIGEGHKALIITICNILIQLPFLFILPRYLGTDGIWLAMPLSAIFLMVPVLFLLIKQVKQMDQTIIV
ncbi:MATE family efflux transporter [Limnobaculum zhutongyuii]|uniref:Multidrug export protein MepA n=1 Tax=Limnobaculum zhutongyuii TaxID=2498113 RepID=A0A411WFR1_9GAMM|nr:MATE family efflux transporter [Limnobaculum zhutongyuii]QBH95151.1 MATE family efflux transporter [Limnobaculum zhutongyuii]TQS86380.1 MATE family efflux transporter [Limnobaculum zhutongyuii]